MPKGDVGVTRDNRKESDSLATWSGKTFWESAAGRVMVRLLQNGIPVTGDSVITALKEQLAEPEQEYRVPAIREAIRRIGAIDVQPTRPRGDPRPKPAFQPLHHRADAL